MRNLTLNPANKQEAKVALVTGGARRIGAQIVKHLHQAGYKVLIHCHTSLTQAHDLATELNHQRANSAQVVAEELSRAMAAENIIQVVNDWAGRLDLLVNNASIFIRSEERLFDNKDWQTLFDVNVKAPYLLSLAARSLLATQQGCIINLSDIHAKKPLKGYAAYCQTKAALDMQTKALAREFSPDIRVNAVAPGAIVWPESGNALSTEQQKQIINQTPLKRHGDPQYIAQAVLALAENDFITGQILKVDGGRSVHSH
jgi:pteridine reductase